MRHPSVSHASPRVAGILKGVNAMGSGGSVSVDGPGPVRAPATYLSTGLRPADK